MTKAALYLGLDPMLYPTKKLLIHYPLIQISPRKVRESDIQAAFKSLSSYTHVLITSKSALKACLDLLPAFGLNIASLKNKQFIAVGQTTANRIQGLGLGIVLTPKNESSEGLISEILPHLPQTTHLLWPHSAQSRPVVTDFLKKQLYRYQECHLYDTISIKPEDDLDLNLVDEIIFTSPSTVDAYLHFFRSLPIDKILTAIGPVTQKYLDAHYKKHCTSAQSHF